MGRALEAYLAFGVPIGIGYDIAFQGFDDGEYIGPEGDYPELKWMTPNAEGFIRATDLAEQIEEELFKRARWVGLEFVEGGLDDYETKFLAAVVLKATGVGFQRVEVPDKKETYYHFIRLTDALKTLQLKPKLGSEPGWHLIPAYN